MFESQFFVDRQSTNLLEQFDDLYDKIFEQFEKDYLEWNTKDVILWLKTINNLNFLVETHFTLIPLLEKRNTTGQTLRNDLTLKNLNEHKVFGTIQILEKEILIYELH